MPRDDHHANGRTVSVLPDRTLRGLFAETTAIIFAWRMAGRANLEIVFSWSRRDVVALRRGLVDFHHAHRRLPTLRPCCHLVGSAYLISINLNRSLASTNEIGWITVSSSRSSQQPSNTSTVMTSPGTRAARAARQRTRLSPTGIGAPRTLCVPCAVSRNWSRRGTGGAKGSGRISSHG